MNRLGRAGCGLLIVAGLSGCVGPGLEPPGRHGQVSNTGYPPNAAGGGAGAAGSGAGVTTGSAGAGANEPASHPAQGSADAGTGTGATKLDQDGGIPADDAGATHP